MLKTKVQAKFNVDSAVLSVFKARCELAGVSMTSIIEHWMQTGQPNKSPKIKTDTRPHRRKAVMEIINLLNDILEKESTYRDYIPEQFEQRLESADYACEQLADAIDLLEDTF